MINKKINLAIVLILISFLAVNFCSAAFLNTDTKQKIENQSKVAGFYGYDTSGDVFGLIQTVINAFLSLVGVILLVYLLSAGYKWMTAHGEEEKVTEAKDTIKRAIVGVIIIVAAYAISIFVMSRLEAGTLKNNSGTNSTSAPTTPAASPNMQDYNDMN